jgi:hypothetical protein
VVVLRQLDAVVATDPTVVATDPTVVATDPTVVATDPTGPEFFLESWIDVEGRDSERH